MERRTLGIGGPDISRIVLGTLHFGIYLDEMDAIRLVHRALDFGISTFDTAPLYGRGRSESILGKALKGHRDRAVIATKVGLAPSMRADRTFSVVNVPLRTETIFSSVEASLRAMGIEWIDILQIHAFDHQTPLEETINALRATVERGIVRWVGVSNFDEQELLAFLRAADGLPVVSQQCHFNLLERRAEDGLIPLARTHGIGTLCNRGLARGILGGQYQAGEALPSNSRAADSPRIRSTLDDSTLRVVSDLGSLGRSYGKTVAAVALAWLLSRTGVDAVVLGTRNEVQLDICQAAVNWQWPPSLSEAVDDIIRDHQQMERVRARPLQFFEK